MLSTSTISERITDYELKILVLLHNRYSVFTTEGTMYRVWTERNGSRGKGRMPIRKDTLTKLYMTGLIQLEDSPRNAYRYVLTPKSREVLKHIWQSRARYRINISLDKLKAHGYEWLDYK